MCNVKLLDSFENAIGLSDGIRFGMALVGVEQKLNRKKRPSDHHQGKWNDLEAHYEMTYVPTSAGELQLLLWYETPIEGRKRWKRTQLPGSPFALTCLPGKYSPAFCSVHCEWAEDPSAPLQLLDFDDGINDVLPRAPRRDPAAAARRVRQPHDGGRRAPGGRATRASRTRGRTASSRASASSSSRPTAVTPLEARLIPADVRAAACRCRRRRRVDRGAVRAADGGRALDPRLHWRDPHRRLALHLSDGAWPPSAAHSSVTVPEGPSLRGRAVRARAVDGRRQGQRVHRGRRDGQRAPAVPASAGALPEGRRPSSRWTT